MLAIATNLFESNIFALRKFHNMLFSICENLAVKLGKEA